MRLSEKFFAALHDDFEEHGVEVIARMRFLRPDVYVSVIAKLMPQKIEVSTPTDGMSDERLAELLDFAERMAGLKTIEGVAVDVTPLAVPPPFADSPTLKAAQEREALLADLEAQHDRLAAVGAVKQALPAVPYPVGRVVAPIDRDVERRNLAKFDDDSGIDPESLF